METSNTAVTNEITKEQSLRALALSLPIEEMLGSVTTYNIDGYDQSSGKGHQQLRTSARVIKKLKLDSTPTSEKDKKFKLDSGYSCDKGTSLFLIFTTESRCGYVHIFENCFLEMFP